MSESRSTSSDNLSPERDSLLTYEEVVKKATQTLDGNFFALSRQEGVEIKINLEYFKLRPEYFEGDVPGGSRSLEQELVTAFPSASSVKQFQTVIGLSHLALSGVRESESGPFILQRVFREPFLSEVCARSGLYLKLQIGCSEDGQDGSGMVIRWAYDEELEAKKTAEESRVLFKITGPREILEYYRKGVCKLGRDQIITVIDHQESYRIQRSI